MPKEGVKKYGTGHHQILRHIEIGNARYGELCDAFYVGLDDEISLIFKHGKLSFPPPRETQMKQVCCVDSFPKCDFGAVQLATHGQLSSGTQHKRVRNFA